MSVSASQLAHIWEAVADKEQARANVYKDVLREVLDFLEHAPISYSNGVTHNGFDEGDVRGGEMHNALVAKIKKTLEHPAIVGERSS
jgi:hypothetical protein